MIEDGSSLYRISRLEDEIQILRNDISFLQGEHRENARKILELASDFHDALTLIERLSLIIGNRQTED